MSNFVAIGPLGLEDLFQGDPKEQQLVTLKRFLQCTLFEVYIYISSIYLSDSTVHMQLREPFSGNTRNTLGMNTIKYIPIPQYTTHAPEGTVFRKHTVSIAPSSK